LRAGGHPRRLRVVLVDRDRPFSEALAAHLGSLQWTLSVSQSPPGVDPLRHARQHAMLVDIGLLGPHWDGWLSRHPVRFPQIAVLVCTGRSSVKERVRGLHAGADDWITKPCAVEEVAASAYFFDYPESNVEATVSYGAKTIPAYGTGTMGYIRPPKERDEADLLGSSGFLLAEVDTSERSPSCPPLPTTPCNVVPVTARVVPNIAQLALDATNGLLLRRSQVSLFEALARRPLGGVKLINEGQKGVEPYGPDPYDKIPFDCLGANCPFEVPTEYTFRSSNPDIGNFVAHDPTTNEPLQVLLGPNKLPVPDEHSGLFCPYNEGTTTVSVTAGGLTYSEPVTVQGGSVEYPCGTVPLTNPPPIQLPAKFNFAPIEPAPAGSPPTSPLVQSILPPAPPAPVHPKPHRVPRVPPLAAVLYAPPVSVARPAIVPPPPTPAAEPTPPSGTSQVFATSPEEKKEEERALELTASRQAVAYDANSSSGGPGPWMVLMLVVIAAGAGVGIKRGRGSRAPERPALALATARRSRRRR
jgi:CheY-like chemotaxis protein